MKKNILSIKGFLLIFFLTSITIQTFAQVSPNYIQYWRNHRGEDKVGASDEKDKYKLSNKLEYSLNPTNDYRQTEGTVYIEWLSSMYWYEDNGSKPWNRLGVVSDYTPYDEYVVKSDGSIEKIYINSDWTFGDGDVDENLRYNGSVIDLGSSKFSGSAILFDIGPGATKTYKVVHQAGNEDKAGQHKRFAYQSLSVTTGKLLNVDVFKLEEGKLVWRKGSKYPVRILKFEIYRKTKGSSGNGDLIKTVGSEALKPGTDDWLLWEDKDAPNTTGSYTYTIYTLLNDAAPSIWNKDISAASSGVTLDVTYLNNSFEATQDLNNKIKLDWSSFDGLNNVNHIRIYRDITGEGNEKDKYIAKLGKSLTSYVDETVIPGKTHTYTLRLFNSTNIEIAKPISDYKIPIVKGKSLLNGRISGTVKTASGVPLEGVTVYYWSKTPATLNDGISTKVVSGSTITDNSGFYQMADIYYDSKTIFEISALPKDAVNKKYQTAVFARTLEIAEPSVKDINFVDTASFVLSGVVYFPKSKFNATNDVPMQDAEIWLNGRNSGVTTDKAGQYRVAIPSAGSQTISAKYNGHKIFPASQLNNAANTSNDAVVFVAKDVPNVNFVDTTFRQVKINAYAYKDRTLGESMTTSVRMRGLNAALTDTIIGSGLTLIDEIKAGKSYNGIPTNSKIFIPIKPGQVSVKLPATSMLFMIEKVAVRNIQNLIDPDDKDKREYFATRSISKDFTNDKVAQINGKDTTYTEVSKLVDFVYYDNTKIYAAVNGIKDQGSVSLNRAFSNIFDVVDLPGGNPNGKEQIFDEREKEKIQIQLLHDYTYPMEGSWVDALNSGTLIISDAISDRDAQELPIDSVTNRAEYTIVAGKPYIDGTNYFKSLSIIGEVKDLKIQSKEYKTQGIVVGENQRVGTFYTRTPEKPLFILHDPPGDNSYASISKGTSMSITKEFNRTNGSGAGVDADIKAGIGGWSPVSGDWGVGVHAVVSFTDGTNKGKGNSSTTTLSFTQDFSTSASEDYVGHDGDLYVGNSQNITYALADFLKYDRSTKKISKGINTVVDSVGVNTTFIYSEKHIKETLMGQFASLIKQAALDSASAYSAMIARGSQLSGNLANKLNDADFKNKYELHQRKKGDYYFHINNQKAWTQVLKQNEENRENAENYAKGAGYLSNISFSAGASYTNTVAKDASDASFTEFETYYELSAGIGAYASGFGAEADIQATFGKSMNEVTTDVSESASTDAITFHLEDDDAGDFFSIDVKEDPMYKTPVFKLLAGTASCPAEDGAQRRYVPSLMPVGTQTQINIPVGKPAIFYVRMANFSESDEEGTFAVRLVSNKNLNGAKVLFGGQDITNGVATYSLKSATDDEREAYIVPVEIYKGAVGVEFKDIQIVMNPDCEGGTDLSDNPFRNYVNLSATWQNTCSSVTLFTPGNNWVVNKSNNDLLNIVLSDYDATENSSLTNVILQYRRLNSPVNWSNLTSPITKAQLAAGKSYQEFVSVASLADGEYELRLVTNCGDGTNYSPTYVGKIDRTIVSIYGIPTPANGILTASDIISVEFNKNIRSDAGNPIKVKLLNTKTGVEYPTTFVLNGKRIEIKTNPASIIEDLENEALKVSVWNIFDNDAGNFLKDTISWGFIVNRSPLYWSPNTKQIDIIEGSLGKFGALIKSKVAVDKNFTISSFPSWITPSIRNGKVSPQGEVNIDFGISNSLNTGTYIDTIKMSVDGREQYFYLTVNVLKEAPKWTVDPSKYKYNMNIVAQFSLTDQNAPLSNDTFDKVAVVVGNEIRGVANIEYDNTLNKYYAFITAYSNDVKETLSYRFWDARPGIEYIAKETTSFVNGGVIGTVSSPLVLHPNGIVQTIPLKKGWNWFSLYLENVDMSINNVLSTLSPSNGDVITMTVNNGTMSEYNTKIGWVGTMNKLDVYNAYRIYVSKPDTIRWTGNLITKEVRQKQNKGWNPLGYPVPYNVALNVYLKNYNFPDGTRIVSQDEFAVYNISNNSWTGSLKYLRPGKGYRIQTTDINVEIPFTVYTSTTNPNNPPVNTPSIPVLPAGPTTIIGNLDQSTNVTINNFETVNTTTVSLNIGGKVVNINNANEQTGESGPKDGTSITNRYEINTVVNNTVVGITNVQVLPNGELRGFVPSSGNENLEGKDVTFLVKDTKNHVTYTAKPSEVVKSIDGTHSGTIETPVVLTLEGNSNVEVKSDLSKQTIAVGQEITFHIDLKNIGDDIAVNVKFAELIPNGFDIVNVTSEKGTINHTVDKFDYQIISLAKESTDRLTFTLKSNRVGVYNLGTGEIKLNNDVDVSNNMLYGAEIEVIDNRSNASKIFIPELFSPNGDGVNDLFEIIGLGDFIKDVTVIIYDRSSNVVHRSTNYQNNWDGGNFPVGSYGYYIKGTDRTGAPIEFRGYVSIVR